MKYVLKLPIIISGFHQAKEKSKGRLHENQLVLPKIIWDITSMANNCLSQCNNNLFDNTLRLSMYIILDKMSRLLYITLYLCDLYISQNPSQFYISRFYELAMKGFHIHVHIYLYN